MPVLTKVAGILSFVIGTAIVSASVASLAQPVSASGYSAVHASVASQGDPAGVFSAKCARCHGDNLEGGDGEQLIGAGNPVFTYGTGDALLRYVMENMPDVAALNFILSKNGVALPPGGMTADNAGSVTIAP
jgi:mono/diheme cytochrome c family protein